MKVVNLIVVSLVVFWVLAACKPAPTPNIEFVAQHQGGEFPTEILFADGRVWLSQLKEDALYVADSFPFTGSPHRIVSSEKVASPHFMAATDKGLFVSEGRGSQVRYFSFDGKEIAKSVETEASLQRPHGLCVKDGWLYIADSVGSRLLRFNLEDKRTEVFADNQKKIAYGRQLLCREDGIWLSNSYEKAFKLNDGTGGNVLLIKDFNSGNAETVVAFRDTNATGIAILDNQLLLVGRWNRKRDIVAVDLKTGEVTDQIFKSNRELDAPYGITVDEKNRRFYVAFLGIHPKRSKGSKGAILEWKY